jgi:hypothetical protein
MPVVEVALDITAARMEPEVLALAVLEAKAARRVVLAQPTRVAVAVAAAGQLRHLAAMEVLVLSLLLTQIPIAQHQQPDRQQ